VSSSMCLVYQTSKLTNSQQEGANEEEANEKPRCFTIQISQRFPEYLDTVIVCVPRSEGETFCRTLKIVQFRLKILLWIKQK